MDETTTSTTATGRLDRTGPMQIVRIGLVGAAAAALVAVGILGFGSTASPGGTLAAGAAAGNAAGNAGLTINLPAGASTDGLWAAGASPDKDGMGQEFGRGRGFGGIEITAISGSKLSLATADGWTRTITVDSGTTYTRSGTTIALADLSVGDAIRFQQTREADGTYSIDAIAVIPPSLSGTVSAISGSSITVTGRDGTTATVKVTGTTTYEVNRTSGKALSDVTVGMFVFAEGTQNDDGSLTAASVSAVDPASMPGPGGHGFRGGPEGGHGNDGAQDDASTPDTTTGSAG